MARKKNVKSVADTSLANPQTRTEEFLAKIAGLTNTLPDGEFSRLERYLKYIAEHGGGSGDVQSGAIAPEFSATETYAAGDFVMKDGLLYEFTASHTGAWDAGDVTAVNAATYLKMVAEANGGIAGKSDLASIQATGSTNTTGAEIPGGTYFYLNGALVLATTSIAADATFTAGTNYSVVTAGALNDYGNAVSDLPSDVTTLVSLNRKVAYGRQRTFFMNSTQIATVITDYPSELASYKYSAFCTIMRSSENRVFYRMDAVSSVGIPKTIVGYPLEGAINWVEL